MRPSVRSAARGRPGERGAALLVVMVAVAVLTALAVDLAYDTRVSLRIAANARDELKASYLARSGVALSRLVLSFQQDVDAAIPRGGIVAGMPALPRPQVWRIVPVGSALAAALFGEPVPPSAPVAAASGAPPAAAAGGPRTVLAASRGGAGAPRVPRPGTGEARTPAAAPTGPAPDGFETVIDDEGRKVNVQLDSSYTSGVLGAQVQAIWQLICDPRWDALFDQEDENGLRVSRQDLIVYLRDWVDDDSQSSALNAVFPTTCVMVLPQLNPFEQGFADENFPYDRGEDRYRAKNARMDSLSELYEVAGVTDAFMAAFRDAITVYMPRDAKRNVNETDKTRLVDLARLVADPPSQPLLYDPEFATLLQKAVMERTYGGMLSLSPSDFGLIVAALGVKVNQSMLSATTTQNPFTDVSSVFRISAVGRAGDVTKSVEAIVRFGTATSGQTTGTGGRTATTAPQAPGAPATPPAQGAAAAGTAAGILAQAAATTRQVTTPGQLVHWRED